MTTFAIRDVNGISEMTINLREPGVYVARGPNGSGKTSAINAVRAACGDNAIAEPTDGLPRGTVELSDGLVLSVGKQRRLNGEPTVQLAHTGALGRLIDPGLVDPAAAAKARIRALLELVPLPADERALHELCDNDAALSGGFTRGHYPDALALAEAVRRQAQEMARLEEATADKAHGELASVGKLLTDLGQVPESAPTVAEAKAAAEQALRVADRTQVAHASKLDLERRQREIRATLGERPNVEALEAARVTATRNLEAMERSLAEAQRQVDIADRAWTAAYNAAKKWDEAAGILNKPAEGPSEHEVLSTAEAAKEAAAALELAQRLAQATEYRRVCGNARTTQAKSTTRATELRRIAARTSFAMGRLLERAGLPGITIHEGRLAVASSDGTVTDFADRLSFGQKVRLALQVALHAQRKRGNAPVLLPLEPEFWLALDATHRAEVCAAAVECGVILVTEEPSEGELRVERMEPQQ